LTYHLSALLAGPEQAPLLRVRSTHIRPENGDQPPRFVVDFAGNWPQQADMNSPATAKIQVSQGQVRNLVIETNDAIGGWQVFFDLAGVGDNRTELRLRLQPGPEPLSETWVYDYQKSN
jgi:VCBS repeat-containing protein